MGMEVFARYPLTYFGTTYERGEIFKLQGSDNDEKIIRVRKVIPVAVSKRRDPYGFDAFDVKKKKCDDCGKTFAARHYWELHRERGCKDSPKKYDATDEEVLEGRRVAMEEEEGEAA